MLLLPDVLLKPQRKQLLGQLTPASKSSGTAADQRRPTCTVIFVATKRRTVSEYVEAAEHSRYPDDTTVSSVIFGCMSGQ